MSTGVRYDREKGFVVVAIAGEVSLRQFEAALEMMSGGSNLPSDVPALWDLREADFQNVTVAQWHRIIEILERHPERARAHVALVVANDYAFGLLEILQTRFELSELRVPQAVEVFKNYGEAEAWLAAG